MQNVWNSRNMNSVLENGQQAAAQPWWARDRGFGLLIIIAGAVSWLAAGQLVLERLELFKNPDYITSCDINPWISCGTVMKSWQGALFGFPNPLLGIVGFGVVITIGFVLLAGAGKLQRWFWLAFQAGITLAMVFIIWLWSQALYEIKALCPYCMVVWAMMIALFVFTTARNITTGVIPASQGLKSFAAGWSWIITVLLWAVVAATILLQFPRAFFG